MDVDQGADNYFAGKRVLVSGASGFLGTWTTRALLSAGAEVVAGARRQSKFDGLAAMGARPVYLELGEPESAQTAMQGCQLVFHFAAMLTEFQPVENYRKVNVEGTRWLAQAALQNGIERFVHISTAWVYGPDQHKTISERDALRPCGEKYADTKAESEGMIREMIQVQGLPAIILQPSEVYGPGDLGWTGMPLRMLEKGSLVLAGGGRGKLQPVFVEDLVAGILLAAERSLVGQIYLLSGSQALTVREFFGYFTRMLGKPMPPSIPPGLALSVAGLAERWAQLSKSRPVYTRDQTRSMLHYVDYDDSKARQELGYRTETSLEAGMEKVKAWWLGKKKR